MHRTLRRSSRAGYSLVELMIACVIGIVVLSSAMSLAVSTFRSLAGLQLREGIDRNARYVGMVLQRDLTETGVLIDATATFGTLAVWNDSISILRVAFDTSAFPQYNLTTSGGYARGVNNPTGASTSLDIVVTAGSVPRLAAGDLARYQLNTTRRLILVSAVRQLSSTAYRVTFSSASRLLHHDAGIPTSAAPTAANVGSAIVQKLQPVMYWRNPA
ncbi:MAG TPA: prepilin-type N-terminal cleavage/methylation domain-containing protein, partial [Gemmatimonadales bacterium]|nr:prepilin-type N-terminal cleavage/methylation domain-containing protein [Gemmatimonadales bacterium]